MNYLLLLATVVFWGKMYLIARHSFACTDLEENVVWNLGMKWIITNLWHWYASTTMIWAVSIIHEIYWNRSSTNICVWINFDFLYCRLSQHLIPKAWLVIRSSSCYSHIERLPNLSKLKLERLFSCGSESRHQSAATDSWPPIKAKPNQCKEKIYEQSKALQLCWGFLTVIHYMF